MKPANILIDSNCQVQLCDFGLARIMPKSVDLEKSVQKLKTKTLNEIIKETNIQERKSKYDEFKIKMSETLANTKEERQKLGRSMSG